VLDEPRQAVLHGAPFAFGHVLDFLGDVVQIGLRDAAGAQQFGVSHSPLREVPIIQLRSIHVFNHASDGKAFAFAPPQR
jgi:hypothetical protein